MQPAVSYKKHVWLHRCNLPSCCQHVWLPEPSNVQVNERSILHRDNGHEVARVLRGRRLAVPAPTQSAHKSAHTPQYQPYFFMRSAARFADICSFSSKSSSKRCTMPGGGPCSMIERIFGVKLMDRSSARDGVLDRATHVASHFASALMRFGNTQWKIIPLSAVLPCIV